MFNFVFDKKSLTLLLAGLTVAGGLLFFAGLLVGVNLGLPGLHQGVAYAPRPLPLPAKAVPCPEPALPVEKPAPAPEPEPEPVQAPPQVAQAAPVEEPPPAPAPAPVEKPERPRAVHASLRSGTSGAFSVQVGAFSQKENSDAVVRELESRGYEPYVVVLPGRRTRLHTVRIGRYQDRQEAQQAAAELRQRANIEGIVQRIDRL